MYYELIILGTLMFGPSYGYLIANIMQNIGGPYTRLSAGRLYPLLKKLEEQGFVAEEVIEQAARRSHISSRHYRLTQAGEKRFRTLLLDTTSYLGDYERLFRQKAVYFSFLLPVERLQLIEHYSRYCQSFLAHGTERMEILAKMSQNSQNAIPMTEDQLTDLLIVMRHTIQGWQQELLWAESLREQVQTSLNVTTKPTEGE